MKTKYILACIFLLCVSGFVHADQQSIQGGYPIANFALTVNVSEEGDLYGQILQNEGKLGNWLTDRGAVNLFIEKSGKTEKLSQFEKKNIDRSFPTVKATYEKSALIASSIRLETFCPLAVNDLETSSLPVVLLEVECENPTKKEDSFILTVNPNEHLDKNIAVQKNSTFQIAGNKEFLMAVDAEAEWNEHKFRIPITLAGKEKKKFRILISMYDPEWVTANQFVSVEAVAEYTYRIWNVLKAKTHEFAQAIPQTGIKDVDTYLHWYMIPAISLTRYNKKGELLTLGYAELNPRDSYWTTWVHLVLFKDAERKMIEECIASVQPSGKMPTTILPLIERKDDLDINAFLILRVARFYQLYHEQDKLQSYWSTLKKVMEWLISRDTAGQGLPRQVSYWGDWKDVSGVTEREYSPFSCLIYLVALKEMIYLGKECDDITAVKRFEDIYQKGYEAINKSVENGGLWNGKYYCQLWKDGSVNDKLLQDQTIGILFDVIPKERSLKIMESLNAMSKTPYGIAETFPYYTKEFGYEPGTYHNGAVWPWVSFMDCWARIRLGQTDDAIDLIKKVGYADIIASGDWSANEHINSITGENLGFHIQGWSAALFGVVYFGLVNQGIIPRI